MSGEFYCIDEQDESSDYREEHNTKPNRSDKAGLHDEQDAHSTGTSKKSGECHLLDIEEQLQKAEDRCNILKSQLDSMKKNYQKTSPRDKIDSRAKNGRQATISTHRKHAVQTQPSTSYTNDIYEDFTFSTNHTQPTIYRQRSNSIGTDNTGASVNTMNNMLSGITASVNKLTHLHRQSNEYNFLDQPFSNDIGGTYTGCGTPFSPRLKERLYEQQKKVDEIMKDSQYPESCDIKVQVKKKSSTSVKSKDSSLNRWSKHLKTNSTSKIGDGPMKAKNTRSVFNDDQLRKRRKRIAKRLKATSKVSISRKPSDSDSQSRKCLPKCSTDSLVELYHNVAAKLSDSDNSNRGTRVQLTSQQGSGDALHRTHRASKIDASFNKSGSRLIHSQRILTPIEENRIVEDAIVRNNYFHHILRNYELPTIASKLKKAHKCYLRSYIRSFNYFNFRCIPFCAATSTGPSFNTLLNIQVAKGAIKGKQPMSSISPTLTHNLRLTAKRFHGSPLSAYVSNLSTRISIGNSTCPLIKHPFNYHKLQEMAKSIPEEPFEEEQRDADYRNSVRNDLDTDMELDKTLEDIDPLPPVPPMWSASPESTRCTCTSQKGVPFQKILSEYQLASSDTSGKCRVRIALKQQFSKYKLKQKDKKHPASRKQVKSSYYNNVKQRTAAWVSNGVKENVAVNNLRDPTNKPTEVPAEDQHQLRGKEKSLKAVLKNLHDEFDYLNTKYEELSKLDTNSNPDTVKELEELEHLLNQKEDEINMVMSLYMEVMALKDQVKKLKERTSCETLLSTAAHPKYKETKAMHLTQLLHQIQNYQNRYQGKAQV